MSVRSSGFIVLFKSAIPVLIFCLDTPSILERILKSPVITGLSISSFSSANIYFIYLGTLMLITYIFIIIIPT